MQKYKKPKFSYKDLGKNPCTNSLEIPIRNLVMKDQFIKDKEEDVFDNVTVTVEAISYTKLYITSDRRKIIAALSPAAKELYLWIMFEVESGEDALWINRERFMVENSTSLNTYKKAIEELIRCILLAYTVIKDVYWINPDFFFKGDRIKKYPTKTKLIQ